MGIIKDVKIQTGADAAAKAAKAGRAVLVYRQNIPISNSGWSGEIGDMGEVIEAIENQGWALDHMAFDGHQSSHGGCILIFRRARPPAQQPQAPPAREAQPHAPARPQQPARPAQQESYGFPRISSGQQPQQRSW